MFRRIEVIGHLGADPEIKHLSSGTIVGTFSVASNEPYTDKDGNRQANTEWFRVVCYQNGEHGLVTNLIQKWLRKGQLVYISGSPTQRKWIDNTGAQRFSFEIKLGPQSTIKMLGGGNGNGVNREPSVPAEMGNNVPNTEAGDPGPDLTVPF